MAPSTILYVEDDPDLSEVVCDLLSAEGYAPVTAREGRQALMAIDAGVHPTVIITDLMMPGLDGFGFLREYRRRPPPHAPVLAVSAFEPYLGQAVGAGATAALAKPLVPQQLLAALARLSAGEAPAAPPPPATDDRVEQARIEAVLRLGLEQGPPSAALRRFAERVRRVFQVRICLISVVTRDRQRWLGACGLPEGLSGAEGTDRQDSFCTHAVAARAALVVHDAQSNPFFAHNRLVREHGFRFYAGVPLPSRQGAALGTLCILDLLPTGFGFLDLELLGVLATRVAGELERDGESATDGAPVAAFRSPGAWDPELDVLGRHAFEEAARIESLRAAERGWPLTLGAVVLPADRARAVADAIGGELPGAHLGRLGRHRLGLAVPREDAAAVGKALDRACGPGAKRVVVEVRAPILDRAPLASVEVALGGGAGT